MTRVRKIGSRKSDGNRECEVYFRENLGNKGRSKNWAPIWIGLDISQMDLVGLDFEF